MKPGIFTHHEPCLVCGSSDANAQYSDGSSHCFSCGYHKSSNVSGYVLAAQHKIKDTGEVTLSVPDDIGYEYSQECLKWVDQYGLTASDLIKNKVMWSARRNQLIYVYQYMDKTGIGCIQARNFNPDATKYYNQGDVNQVLPIYHYTKAGEANHLVIVEDALSAIKVSRDIWVDAMPLLGSHLALHKLAKLKPKGYARVTVWLDHDKYKEAISIADKLRYTGVESKVVTSDLDPKCYSMDVIAIKLGLL